MQRNLTQQQKVFIEFLTQKFNAFLDSALGSKIPDSQAKSNSSLDPLILFSKHRIKREIYRRSSPVDKQMK